MTETNEAAAILSRDELTARVQASVNFDLGTLPEPLLDILSAALAEARVESEMRGKPTFLYRKIIEATEVA